MRVEPVVGEPALILRGRIRYLVVADLHLGLVRYYDEFIVKKLQRLADELRVDEIIILGDLKHILGYDRRIEEMVRSIDFTLVKGNHDGKLKGERELSIGKFQLIHGHLKPKEIGKNLIVAHAHPSVYLNGVKERVWLRGKWGETNVIVMPSFNDLCSSTPVNLRKPAGFLFKDWNYLEADLITVDCVMIGKVKNFTG
jgi:putative SbcD/Mre11-related phosphoesterase